MTDGGETSTRLVVIADLPADSTAVGVPARVIR